MSVPYWRLSGFYLCYFATLGGFIPYWSLYLKENGFNPAEIGQLSALLVGTKIIAPNLWGWIADHTRKNLWIIRWTSFVAALLFAGFLAVHNYMEFAWITIGFSFFWNASLPLYEATTLSHLQPETHRYSRIRLWGSVGFILTVTSVGKLLDSQPIILLPVVVIGLLVLTWLTTLATPEIRSVSNERSPVRIASIIKKPEVLAFLLVYVLIQFSHAPYYVFYSIYLKQHLYSTTTTGLLWSLGVIAEIVLFLFMQGMLKRYSLRGILLTSLLFAILRWVLIGGYVDNIYLLMFAQLLHAATFGATHIAAIHFVHRFFDQQHQAKGQALYHSLSFGLGGMLGSLFSGYYWESLGSHVIYFAAALSCGIAFFIAYIWVDREDNLSLRKAKNS
ncbi:MFS transporter [Methyloglobulus sp.]|uniref:MFS transporter n=1 Tax=Methyloglobulus sp. TaxID=2518622 RepID=UPI003988FB8A